MFLGTEWIPRPWQSTVFPRHLQGAGHASTPPRPHSSTRTAQASAAAVPALSGLPAGILLSGGWVVVERQTVNRLLRAPAAVRSPLPLFIESLCTEQRATGEEGGLLHSPHLTHTQNHPSKAFTNNSSQAAPPSVTYIHTSAQSELSSIQ